MQNLGNSTVIKDQTNNNDPQSKSYVYTNEECYRCIPTALTVLSIPKSIKPLNNKSDGRFKFSTPNYPWMVCFWAMISQNARVH